MSKAFLPELSPALRRQAICEQIMARILHELPDRYKEGLCAFYIDSVPNDAAAEIAQMGSDAFRQLRRDIYDKYRAATGETPPARKEMHIELGPLDVLNLSAEAAAAATLAGRRLFRMVLRR
jgi:hypothetical protein